MRSEPISSLLAPTLGHAVRFLFGPGSVLGALGWLRPDERAAGSHERVAAPVERWQDATVDVVIPLHGHQATIVHCLSALLAQTLKPRRVVLVDDGGVDRDGGAVLAREFANANAMALEIVGRRWSIGRTPTLKRQARESDADVLFVLDADTVLQSPDYLRHCVQALYRGCGVASAAGTVLPLRRRDRRIASDLPGFRRWVGRDEYRDLQPRPRGWARTEQWLADSYRECTALVQQRFVHRGQMHAFGSIAHPPGGAVAYRRRYLKDVFDRYEPVHGEALAQAEDVFIGFALANEGYRNVQLADVTARAQQRELARLPVQIAHDAVAYLRGCFHFDALLHSPLRWPGHRWRRLRQRAPAVERRRVAEPYRQPFGERLTREQGRPVGWVLVGTALEKALLPAALLVLAAFGQWGWLAAALAVELLAWLLVLAAVAPQARGRTLLKGLLVAPLRYVAMLADLAGVLGFARERWRKRGAPRRLA